MGIFPRLQPVLKNLGSFWIMATLLLFFQGCNSQMADLSPIKNAPFTLTTRNLTNTSNVIIYMTNSTGTESFAKMFTTNPRISMEVPRGNYDFYGISYNGNSVSQCAIQRNVPVKDLENPIELNFDSSQCTEEIFNFASTDIEFCETVKGITSLNGRCSDDMSETNREGARGHVLSFRWSLQGFTKNRGNLKLTGEDFWSACTDTLPTTLRSLSANPMDAILPAGDGTTTPFFIRLELWPAGTGCGTGEPVYVDLPRGLVSDNATAKYFNDGTSQKLYVQIGGEDICQGNNLTGEFVGGNGTEITPKLICNEEQFYHIFPVIFNSPSAALYSSYANFHYKLLANIDLSDKPVTGSGLSVEWSSCVAAGSNFMPIGTTWDGTSCYHPGGGGSFDGGGKKIKGLKILSNGSQVGFYGSSSNMRIQRLTIEDAEVEGFGNVGVVAGLSVNNYFRKLNVKNSRVSSNTGNFAGGFVGQDLGSAFRDIYIKNASVTGMNNVGGLGGKIAKGTSAPIMNRIFVDGEIAGNQYVGGIAGTIGTDGTASIVNQTRFLGSVEASSSYLGGLFGTAISTSISNSYANAFYNTTYVAPTVYFGGLVGYMARRVGGNDPSGIFSSFVLGSLQYGCTPVVQACALGTIIGDRDATFSAIDFMTAVYRISDALSTTPTSNGASQPDATFLSANPEWFYMGGNISGTFDRNIWVFRDGATPSLVQEPD